MRQAPDRFNMMFSNITGNDTFPLGIGSRDADANKNGTGTGHVTTLQKAANKIAGYQVLVPDGIFGNATAALAKKYNNGIATVDMDTYNTILARAAGNAASVEDANPGSLVATSDADLQKMWKASGSTLTYDKWLKQQKVKSAGQGLWAVASAWLQQQSGSGLGGTTGDASLPNNADQPVPTSNKIAGLPAPVFYVGMTALGVLAVWGLVTVVRKAGTKKVVVETPPSAGEAVRA